MEKKPALVLEDGTDVTALDDELDDVLAKIRLMGGSAVVMVCYGHRAHGEALIHATCALHGETGDVPPMGFMARAMDWVLAEGSDHGHVKEIARSSAPGGVPFMRGSDTEN